MFGSIGVDIPCEIRYLQIEKKEFATPYVIGTRESRLYNETAYNQPTTVQNLSLSKETKSGVYSGKFGNGSYSLITTALDLTNSTDLTMAC